MDNSTSADLTPPLNEDRTLSQAQWERAGLSGDDSMEDDSDGEVDVGEGGKEGNHQRIAEEGEEEGSEEVDMEEEELEGDEEDDEEDEDEDEDEALDLSDHENDETLYCICRSRDDGRFMVSCDQCNEWYHVDCIGMPKTKV